MHAYARFETEALIISLHAKGFLMQLKTFCGLSMFSGFLEQHLSITTGQSSQICTYCRQCLGGKQSPGAAGHTGHAADSPSGCGYVAAKLAGLRLPADSVALQLVGDQQLRRAIREHPAAT